jgi:hypothetical protein
MIRRRRGRQYPAPPASTGSDTDELQTDVMRFMSILGLCLMAVFALVQSIPPEERRGMRPEPEFEKLHQDVALQQERARALQADVQRLTAEIRNARERQSNAQRVLSSTQQQLTLLVDQARQARSDRDHVTAELEMLHRQLAQGRDELAGIQQAARDKAQSLHELQQRLGAEQKRLDAISQRAGALHTEQPAAPPSPVMEKSASRTAGPEKRGFTLRFASTEALQRLVASGAVSLYAMAGKQAWRLSLSQGSPLFAPDAFPRWFHEMEPTTVPVGYLQALATSVSPRTPSSVVWGVQLPASTKQRIASLTRDLRGGNLLIEADGQVALEAE